MNFFVLDTNPHVAIPGLVVQPFRYPVSPVSRMYAQFMYFQHNMGVDSQLRDHILHNSTRGIGV